MLTWICFQIHLSQLDSCCHYATDTVKSQPGTSGATHPYVPGYKRDYAKNSDFKPTLHFTHISDHSGALSALKSLVLHLAKALAPLCTDQVPAPGHVHVLRVGGTGAKEPGNLHG